MPRKIQTSFIKSNARHSIACIGDSLTHNHTLGVWPHEFWPESLATKLRASPNNAGVQARNFGKNGDPSAGMIERFAHMTRFDTPVIGLIYGGVNDSQYSSTVQASPAPTTTTFSVAAAKGLGYRAGSYALVNGVSKLIQSVATDAITVSVPFGAPPSAGQTVAPDTQINLQTMVASLVASGCSRNVILGLHYYNYTALADTTSVELAANATLRGLQRAAATASGAVYCDLYAYMRALILAGTVTQGSFSWHVADSNLHLNAYGEGIVADAVLQTIQAQTGWIAALT